MGDGGSLLTGDSFLADLRSILAATGILTILASGVLTMTYTMHYAQLCRAVYQLRTAAR